MASMIRQDEHDATQSELPRGIPRRLLTASEAAAVLHISRSKVYQLIASGELASVTIGRSRRVCLTAIDEFIAKLQSDGM
jgi:excisionase family DNA binding protein